MRFNETLEQIKIYEAGKPIELVVREFGIKEEEIVKLASNENPYGAPPAAMEAVKESAAKIHLYPDDSMHDLKRALGERFGVESFNIIVGSGSDQILEFAARAILNSDTTVLMSRITFAMYEIYALQQGAKIVRSGCYRHDLEEFYELYLKHSPAMIHICTPNNPTGDAIDREYLYSFLEKVRDSLIVVDGAYMEYAAYKDERKRIDPKDIIDRFDNVLYLGTFSKAFGLGGLRIGYGIAKREVIENLYKLRPPFNVTSVSLKAAQAALGEIDFVNSTVQKSFSQMERYVNYAIKRGFEYIDSYTNFITYIFDKELSSKMISESLLKRGVIVRDLGGYGLNGIRITIGTPKQNDILFEKLDEVLNGY